MLYEYFNSENQRMLSELKIYVGFQVVTAVVMKSTVSWDIPLCRPLKVNGLQVVTCQKTSYNKRKEA
jgi:hypothetical protein